MHQARIGRGFVIPANVSNHSLENMGFTQSKRQNGHDGNNRRRAKRAKSETETRPRDYAAGFVNAPLFRSKRHDGVNASSASSGKPHANQCHGDQEQGHDYKDGRISGSDAEQKTRNDPRQAERRR